MKLGRVIPAAVLPIVLLDTIVASTPWFRAYSGLGIQFLVIAASAIAIAVPIVVARTLGRSLAWSAGANAFFFVAFCLFAVLRAPFGLGQLFDGLVKGPAHLLSVTLPISEPRWALVPAIALCWLCGSFMAEVIIRSRWLSLPALCPVIAFAVAFAVTESANTSMIAQSALLLIGCGALVLALRFERDQRTTLSLESQDPADDKPRLPLVSGIVILVVVVTLGSLAVSFAPGLGKAPEVIRRSPPASEINPKSPTVTFAEMREGPAANLFSVMMDQPGPTYLDAVVLDAFNGGSWQVNPVFLPTGGHISGAPVSEGTGTRGIIQHYSIMSNLSFPWIPFLNSPILVGGGVPFDFNTASGMIVPSRSLTAGDSYAVTSVVPSKTLSELVHLDTSPPSGSGAGSTNDLAISQDDRGVVSSFEARVLLGNGEVQPSETYTYLLNVQHYLLTHVVALPPKDYKSTPQSLRDAFGTSDADLDYQLLGASPTCTPEQCASLMVLVARSLGIPARLVDGFRISGTDGATVGGHDYVVTTRDSWSWAEIYASGIGWIVVDPTPSKQAQTATPSPGQSSTSSTTIPQQLNAINPTTGLKSGYSPPKPITQSWTLRVLLIAAAVLMLVALAPISIAIMKRRRRRVRRRGSEPSRAIEGAWIELIDTLGEADVRGLQPLTNAEIAAKATGRFGSEAGGAVSTLARTANQVAFSDEIEVDRGDVDDAWMNFESFRRSMSASQSLGERWRSKIRLSTKRRRARD